MKANIHPNYVEAIVKCACGETFKTRSTKPEIHLEICSKCHPFFTGKQKLVDTAGRVERFQQKVFQERIKGFDLMFHYFRHLALTATSWALGSSNDDILVGGQAVIEGVMMRSPKGYSVAVRRQDGTVRVMKDALQTVGEKWKALNCPIIRGVGVLGQALVLGIKALRFSAEEALAEDSEKQRRNRTMLKRLRPG